MGQALPGDSQDHILQLQGRDQEHKPINPPTNRLASQPINPPANQPSNVPDQPSNQLTHLRPPLKSHPPQCLRHIPRLQQLRYRLPVLQQYKQATEAEPKLPPAQLPVTRIAPIPMPLRPRCRMLRRWRRGIWRLLHICTPAAFRGGCGCRWAVNAGCCLEEQLHVRVP